MVRETEGKGAWSDRLRGPQLFSPDCLSTPVHCCLPLPYLVLASASLFLPASLCSCSLSLDISSFSASLRASWDFCFGTLVLYLHMPFGFFSFQLLGFPRFLSPSLSLSSSFVLESPIISASKSPCLHLLVTVSLSPQGLSVSFSLFFSRLFVCVC